MQGTEETHIGKDSELYKAKAIIKKDVCMKFYSENEPLYLNTDIAGVGLGAGLLGVRTAHVMRHQTIQCYTL